jgi:hypothetical protein
MQYILKLFSESTLNYAEIFSGESKCFFESDSWQLCEKYVYSMDAKWQMANGKWQMAECWKPGRIEIFAQETQERRIIKKML